MERFYSDRVTTFYVSPSMDDELVVHEVTLEPVEREQNESVDFSTWAWCPDEECADKIARALNIYEELDSWFQGDEQERTAPELVEALGRLLK